MLATHQSLAMESVEDCRPVAIDPWQVNGVTRNLKEGLDLNKLQTTGADFELITTEQPQIEEIDVKENQQYQEKVLRYLNPKCMDIQDDEGSDSDTNVNMTPFEKMALGMEDLTGDGGVLKKVLEQGLGPVVPKGAMVTVHYNGYLEYSDEPYDSSRLRNQQQHFKLGKGEVIHGWEIGVASMKRKECARFLIQAPYAFGTFGCPPRIPPNATIMFEIEMMNFVDVKVADDFAASTKEEKEAATLDEIIAVANAIRMEGNNLFHRNNFSKASTKYLKAVRLLENRRLKDEQEELKWRDILVKLYLNLSLCHLRMRRPKPAISHCRRVLELDPKNVKATFRLGQAYMQLSEWKQSRAYMLKAGRLSPGNVEIRQELEKLNKAVSKFKSVEKKLCTKMFPMAQPATVEDGDADEDEDEEDVIPLDQLEEYRELYHEKFSLLCNNPDMMELVVPLPLPKRERECVEQVASQLDLLTEMIPQSGLKVYKKILPEMEKFMEDH